MNGPKKYHSLEIELDNGAAALVRDSSHLYQEGFSFDLRSLKLDTNGRPTSLNLYFNPTGPGALQSLTNGMTSARIGLLDDVLAGSSAAASWVTTVTEAPDNLTTTTIGPTAFLGPVHARANLQHWYARTWQNITHPGNLYQAGVQINAAASDNTRVVAAKFDEPIDNESAAGVDLVTA